MFSVPNEIGKLDYRWDSWEMVAILYFEHISTSHKTGSTTTRKFDLENIGVAICSRNRDMPAGGIPFPPVAIGGGYQGFGGQSPPNLQPNMADIRNAEAAL